MTLHDCMYQSIKKSLFIMLLTALGRKGWVMRKHPFFTERLNIEIHGQETGIVVEQAAQTKC